MVELILNELNAEISSTSATYNLKLAGVDAVGVIELSVNLFKTIFLYQTDTNFEQNQIKYYTIANPDFLFNPSNSKLDASNSFGAIEITDTNLMSLKHDYIRYLSLKLFGTQYGVYLFTNEGALLQSLNDKIVIAMETNYNLLNSLNYIDGSNANLVLDTLYQRVYDYRINKYVYCYTKHTNDSFNTGQNLCRELMLQMLELDPARFENIQNPNVLQSLPFISGDTINFKIGINAAEGQELLTNVRPIPKRTYQIKIILTDSITYTIPEPSSLARVTYTSTNPSPRLKFTNYSALETYDYVLFKFSLYLQTAETNIENGQNTYVTGMLKIYPKAFIDISNVQFNNIVNGSSNYEIDASNGRMFYINRMKNVNSAANALTLEINGGDFIFNINTPMIANLQIELRNNGKLPMQYISSQNLDNNFI